jgi:hypothetical protein
MRGESSCADDKPGESRGRGRARAVDEKRRWLSLWVTVRREGFTVKCHTGVKDTGSQRVMTASVDDSPQHNEMKSTVTVGQSRSQSRIHSRVCTGLCCVPTVSLHFRIPTTRPVATFHQRHPIHTRHSMRILTKNSQFSEPTYSSYQTLHPGGATHYEFLASNVSSLTLPLSLLSPVQSKSVAVNPHNRKSYRVRNRLGRCVVARAFCCGCRGARQAAEIAVSIEF